MNELKVFVIVTLSPMNWELAIDSKTDDKLYNNIFKQQKRYFYAIFYRDDYEHLYLIFMIFRSKSCHIYLCVLSHNVPFYEFNIDFSNIKIS